jgi:hypothetical protein
VHLEIVQEISTANRTREGGGVIPSHLLFLILIYSKTRLHYTNLIMHQ